MSGRQLRLVASNCEPNNRCGCRTWGLLRSTSRGLVLSDLVDRAGRVHGVGLELQVRYEHVVIADLMAPSHRQGHARAVLAELCAWADCARVTLELTPLAHWGPGVDRLTTYCAWLGFEPNCEEPTLFLPQEALIRYPVRGRTHVRL
jgi:hypothetical protein